MPAGVSDWLIVRFDGYVTNVGDGPLDYLRQPAGPGEGGSARAHGLRVDDWSAARWT